MATQPLHPAARPEPPTPGRRIARKRFTATTHTATRHFYYTANWQCIEQREDDLSDPPTLATQYVWGLRYIDDLIQRQRDTSGEGLDETLYALNDRQFNVVALWDPDATAGNELVQRIVVTPYGTPTFLTKTYAASTNTKAWEHCFQGLRTDAESGLIENRNRVLHPLLGRFLQRDPLGYPDGLNAYAGYQIIWATMDATGTDSNSFYQDVIDISETALTIARDVAADTAVNNTNTRTVPGGSVRGHIEVADRPKSSNRWTARYTSGPNDGQFATRDNLKKQIGKPGAASPSNNMINSFAVASLGLVADYLETKPYDYYVDSGESMATMAVERAFLYNLIASLDAARELPDGSFSNYRISVSGTIYLLEMKSRRPMSGKYSGQCHCYITLRRQEGVNHYIYHWLNLYDAPQMISLLRNNQTCKY